MEMDSKPWQGVGRGRLGGKEVAGGKVEKGKLRTRWRSTEPLREKQVPPTPRPSHAVGGDEGSLFPPRLPLVFPGLTPSLIQKPKPREAAGTPSSQASPPSTSTASRHC